MSDPYPTRTSSKRAPNKTRAVLEGADTVPDALQKFPPVAWVVRLIQNLVAVMILAIGRMLRLTFQKDKDKRRDL